MSTSLAGEKSASNSRNDAGTSYEYQLQGHRQLD